MARLDLSVATVFMRLSHSRRRDRFTPYDPKFEGAMEVARRGMKIYCNALADLAK